MPRGFTLLELLVVLGIIGLAATLAIPTVTSTESKVFAAQVRQAESVLNYARRIAIVRSMPSTANFRAGEALGREGDLPGDPAAGGSEFQVPVWKSEELSLRFRTTPNESAREVEQVSITFFPQGGSSGGELQFRMGRQSAFIKVDPITGRFQTRFE